MHHCMLFAVDGSKEKQKLLPLRAHLQPGRGQRGEAFISTMGPRASTCNGKLISCRKRRPMGVKHAGGQCMGSGQHGRSTTAYASMPAVTMILVCDFPITCRRSREWLYGDIKPNAAAIAVEDALWEVAELLRCSGRVRLGRGAAYQCNHCAASLY